MQDWNNLFCCSYILSFYNRNQNQDYVSKGNIFRVTGPLWGESTGHRIFYVFARTNGWTYNGIAGDLGRHDVYVASL